MSKRQASAAILDGIATDLGLPKQSRKTIPKIRCPTGEVSAELADPTGVSTGQSTSSKSQPTGLVDLSETVPPLDNPTGVHVTVPLSSGEPNPSVQELSSTVQALASQMAWFVDQLTGETTTYEQRELDTPQSQTQNVSSAMDVQLATPPGPSSEETVSDTLTGLEQFYDVGDNLAIDVDGQLSNIVNNLTKTRLSDDKLKEKLGAYVRPGNCEGLTLTRVNPEIWEKLSAATKSRDLKAQKAQNATVQAMVAITAAADNIVGCTRAGETLSETKMASTLTGLVDALALLSYANQDVNQRRREDHRSDLNQAYKSLCNSDTDGSAWLYGDDLANRIKSINETNRVANRLGASVASSGYRGFTRGRATGGRALPFAPHRPNWRGSFRGGFLGHEYRHNFRGKSSHRRGRRAGQSARAGTRSGDNRDA